MKHPVSKRLRHSARRRSSEPPARYRARATSPPLTTPGCPLAPASWDFARADICMCAAHDSSDPSAGGSRASARQGRGARDCAAFCSSYTLDSEDAGFGRSGDRALERPPSWLFVAPRGSIAGITRLPAAARRQFFNVPAFGSRRGRTVPGRCVRRASVQRGCRPSRPNRERGLERSRRRHCRWDGGSGQLGERRYCRERRQRGDCRRERGSRRRGRRGQRRSSWSCGQRVRIGLLDARAQRWDSRFVEQLRRHRGR